MPIESLALYSLLGAEDLKGQVEKYKDELTTSTGKLSEHDILIIHILLGPSITSFSNSFSELQ